jgi:hypothetical protein
MEDEWLGLNPNPSVPHIITDACAGACTAAPLTNISYAGCVLTPSPPSTPIPRALLGDVTYSSPIPPASTPCRVALRLPLPSPSSFLVEEPHPLCRRVRRSSVGDGVPQHGIRSGVGRGRGQPDHPVDDPVAEWGQFRRHQR